MGDDGPIKLPDVDTSGWLVDKSRPKPAIGRRHRWSKPQKSFDKIAMRGESTTFCLDCGLERSTSTPKPGAFQMGEFTTTYRVPDRLGGDGRWTRVRPVCPGNVRQGELFSGARIDPPTSPAPIAPVAIAPFKASPPALVDGRATPFIPKPAEKTFMVRGVDLNGCSVTLEIDADGDVFCDEWAWAISVHGLRPTEPAPFYRGEWGIRRVDAIAERVRKTAPRRVGVSVRAIRVFDQYARIWAYQGPGRVDGGVWSFHEMGRR